MKRACSMSLIVAASLIASPIFAKRPKQKPKQNNSQKTTESEEIESHGYHPNPVILAGVGHIMNGALNIAQDPHSRPNVGHSVASMIYGIMSIVIEKVANKKIDMNDPEALEECLNELCDSISNEITEIIITKNFTVL
jgi:hypothetical protein